MTQTNPIVQTDVLQYQENEQNRLIALDSPEWYKWLDTASSFNFTNEHGNFTARKEPASNGRGGYYWRAYRKKAGKLYRSYLGKSQELTLERLSQVAFELSEQIQENKPAETEPVTSPPTQSEPLVATKLFMPELPQPLVTRPRLTEQLNAANNSRIILVSAPAGSGKTTAVVEWLRQTSPQTVGRVAWLSLDEGDNEPARFWSYVSQTLKLEQTAFAQNLAGLMAGMQPPSVEKLVTGLINGVVALNENLTLVLDDYHVITSPQIHQGIAFLVEHLPPHLRLVITSRADPPLPLPRLRLRRQLTELRSGELRFNLSEADAFLKAVTGGLPLSPRNVSDLESKTEGWAAALQLAGLLMQSHRDLNKFIENFSGKQRFMLDYLAEEVLQAQPEEIQNFLIQTSVLERFNAGLVEELTGCEDGQEMLERLMRANLFLIPLDDEHNWYRYHHLFRQYLLRHLEQTQAEHLPWLHRWAARWYNEHDLQTEAIEHALKAGDFLQAAEWIDGQTREMYQRSELRTLWRWLEAIPATVIEEHPHTGLNCAWVLILTGRYESAEPYVKLVEELIEWPAIREKYPPVYIRAYQGEAAAVRAFLSRNRGDFIASIELSHKALDLIVPALAFLRCAILINLARCYVAIDDLPAAVQKYSEVERLSQSGGGRYFWLLAIVSQARLLAEQGQLQLSLAACRRALQVGQGQNLPILGLAYLTLGNLWREWNDLEKALEYLNQAQNLLEPVSDQALLEIYLERTRVKQAQGDLEAALQEFQRAEQLESVSDLLHSGDYNGLEQARLRFSLLTGVGFSQEWAGIALSDNQNIPHFKQELELLLLARVKLAQISGSEALELLGKVEGTAQPAGRQVALLESWLLQALAHRQLNQPEQAQSLLIRVLQLAEPAGFVRLFLDEGRPLLDLLENLARSGEANELSAKVRQYLHRLLEAGGISQAAPAVFPQETIPFLATRAVPAASSSSSKSLAVLVEPLTEREQAVLQLLATTALDSNQIAQELSIAVSTLRTHIKNIYGKLEVQSRLQAITRARELGLISE